ncbi:MAG: phosphotransferase [Clostridia bacterium]|nr:phosphotransferase [Clostridia bacterium]
MALETSILNQGRIANILGTHYGIGCADVERLPLGSANCYRVLDGEKYYFLKEFQSDFSEDDLTREAGVVDYLASHGIPVARFLPTLQNAWFVDCEGHMIALSEYIDGITYGYDDMPPRRLCDLAAMLGQLHATLRDYPLPVDMGQTWLDAYSAEKTAQSYDALLATAAARMSDPNTPQILTDLTYKKDLAYRLEEYKKYYDGVTYNATHGDYQGCQLIWKDDGIRAVIDFSSARTLPVVWEVMRSFVQSSEVCRRDAKVDLAALCDYVRTYMRYFPLSRTDLDAMPYVYLFQLARSRYGYPQYLDGTSEDSMGLLHFATWRTAMCREVESRAGEIARALLNLSAKN